MDEEASKRGFAAMIATEDGRERQQAIARRGGQSSPGNFKNNPQKARAAGRKGGLKSRSHQVTE